MGRVGFENTISPGKIGQNEAAPAESSREMLPLSVNPIALIAPKEAVGEHTTLPTRRVNRKCLLRNYGHGLLLSSLALRRKRSRWLLSKGRPKAFDPARTHRARPF